MVNTRMEGRLEQLERVVEEGQRKQGDMMERLTGIEATLATILEKMSRGRTPSPKSRPEPEETVNPRNNENRDERGDNVEEEGQREATKYRKLELPLFDGDDPIGWVFKVERYFAVSGIMETEKLDAAVVSLEGKALTWFQWLETRTPIRSWKEFKSEVTERFHCKQAGDEYEQLLALKQTGSVTEFREKFELLSAPLDNATEEVLVGAFMNGLREEIRCDVKLMHPQNLKQLMAFAGQVDNRNTVKAKLKELKNKFAQNVRAPRWSETKSMVSKFSATDTWKGGGQSAIAKTVTGRGADETKIVPISSRGTAASRTSTISDGSSGLRRRLSEAEINRRRELGLCFKCEEKFGPNHKCKNKQLQVIILEEGTEDPAQVEDADEFVDAIEGTEVKEMTSMELSITTAVGITGKKTLKMTGTMMGRTVTSLLMHRAKE